MRLGLHQLAQSAATDGQVPGWDNTNGVWVPSDVVLGLTSADTSVTITDNGDGTLDLAAVGGGGGGGLTNLVPTIKKRTAGHVSVTSTTFTAFDTATDITLAAASGDTIELGLSARSPAVSPYLLWDVATINPATSAIIHRWEGGVTDGINAWACPPLTGGNAENVPGPPAFFPLVASDIFTSQVKLRLYVRVSAAGTRTVYAGATGQFSWWARNVKQ